MPQKIMIVEDDDMISDMYKIKFEAAGYSAIVCPDGENAFDTAKKEKPDLILLDVMMPKVSGYDVLKRLKTDEETKDLKVYILSNLVQDGATGGGSEIAADGYLVKSDLTPAQLVETVKKALSGEEVGLDKSKFLKQIKKNGNGKNGNTNGNGKPAAPGQNTVLLIEDEEAIIDMYKYRLEQDGFAVEVAKNGAWGLKMAKEKKFDVILMDMVMPAMGGYEAIKSIKSEGASKDSPVIVMSNSAQDRDIKEALECGAANYLIKSANTPAKIAEEARKCLNH